MNDPIDQAVRRTRRYWYVDGLNEIALGGLCLLPVIYIEVQGSLKTASFLGLVLGVGLVLFIPILLLKAVKFLKERITYPRTGYVSYGQPSVNRRLAISLLAAAVALVFTAIYLVAPVEVNWMAGLTGLVLAIAQLVIGWRLQLSRFLVLSLISLGGGVFLALTQPDSIAGVLALYFLESVALLASGGFTFWAYLRRTQPFNETEP